MITRYVTYFVQFVVSILVAAKLGPFFLGIWGFILLLINYFNIFNFGIPNSTTVLMVKNKKDQYRASQIEVTSMVLMGIIGLIIILIGVYYSIFGIPLFDKYQLGSFFYLVCAIAIMQHFVSLFSLIARVRGSIAEVAFAQSVIPFLTLIAVLFFNERQLLLFLVLSYLVGNILAFFLFVFKKLVHFKGKPTTQAGKNIINKGKYLFVYNVCFYLIFLSTKTVVSKYYLVEEFGFFTFAYTLSNAVLLMMQAFTAIVFPKLIDKFSSDNHEEVSKLLRGVRDCYVTFAHGIMYIAFLLFPVLIYFLPKYQSALTIVYYMGLTLLLYANSFGFSTLLIAQNAEKKIALISFISFVLNVLLAIVLATVVKCDYQYVIFSTMISYLVFTILCVIHGKRILMEDASFLHVLQDSFPWRLLIPYLLMIAIVIFNGGIYLMVAVSIAFFALNFKSFKKIFALVRQILFNPNIVDLKS